ncbi:MAG: hypothetical protein ACYTET_01975 [Planctomycetota bacterium]|jgi:hypothetical protein
MLKTLRITSLIAAILAASGVVLIVITGLRADADIVALLDSPGIAELFAGKNGGEKSPKEADSPLVTQAKAFALRIDPPPPPKPVTPVKTEPVKKPEIVRNPPPIKPTPPGPKGPVNAKFTLLATVQCESNPEKSLALLQTSPTKQEWFWQGQQVGHLDIQEVRNGSVIFSQNGQNEQELFVPVKTQAKSILKEDNLSAPKPAGPGSLNVLLNPDGTAASAEAPTAPAASQTPVRTSTRTNTGAIQMTRSRTTNPRSDASARVQRVRSVPKQQTPEERKAAIDKDISIVTDIMTTQNSADMSEEERAKDKENWKMLIEILQTEKNLVDKKQKASATVPKGSDTKKSPPAGSIKPSEEEAPKKTNVTRKRPAASKEEE